MKEINTFNLDEVVKNSKMPRFLHDEIHLDGTSNLPQKEEAQISNPQKRSKSYNNKVI